eukprot:5598536-Prymnesium_polylepis.1
MVGAALPGVRDGLAVGCVVWAKLGAYPWWPARVRLVLRKEGKLRVRPRALSSRTRACSRAVA